jgi:murein DD-endopeptidase MepM/ murein hydrolase activator NlpD
MLFAGFVYPHSAEASLINDKKRQIEDLQRQINENQAKVSEKAEQIESLKDQIGSMDSQIRETELQIRKTQIETDQTQLEIDSLKTEIQKKTDEMNEQKANLGETIRVVYEAGSPGMLEVLVGANSFSEAINRSQYLDSLSNKIEDSVNKISKIKIELEGKKADQEKKQESLANLLVQQKNYQGGLESQKSYKDRLLGETKGQEAEYQRILSQKYAEWEKSSAELRQMEGGKISVSGSYSLPFWPMHGRLGVGFGASGCEDYFCGRTHTGIDIIASPYAEIKAAKDGVVEYTFSGCNDFGSYSCGGGYGNNVRIRHSDGYLSIYAHMTAGSVRVSPGQSVKGGQTVLGQEGSSGFSTGYHLHFEIRNPAGSPTAPGLP